MKDPTDPTDTNNTNGPINSPTPPSPPTQTTPSIPPILLTSPTPPTQPTQPIQLIPSDPPTHLNSLISPILTNTNDTTYPIDPTNTTDHNNFKIAKPRLTTSLTTNLVITAMTLTARLVSKLLLMLFWVYGSKQQGILRARRSFREGHMLVIDCMSKDLKRLHRVKRKHWKRTVEPDTKSKQLRKRRRQMLYGESMPGKCQRDLLIIPTETVFDSRRK